MPKPSSFWLVQGYDGLQRILRKRLSIALSEREISALLQRLASRHLTPREILAASLRANMKGYAPLLTVQRDPGHRLTLSVGENPHYSASVFTFAEAQFWDEPI